MSLLFDNKKAAGGLLRRLEWLWCAMVFVLCPKISSSSSSSRGGSKNQRIIVVVCCSCYDLFLIIMQHQHYW